MKFLFYIAVIAAAAWSGWHFYPDIYDGMHARIEDRKKEKAQAIAAAVQKKEHDDRQTASGGSQASALLEAMAKKKEAGETMPAVANTNPPGSGESGSKPVKPVAVIDEIEAKYPMPAFKAIEEITKDWTSIPSKAFPRKIKTKVPLVFEGAAGKVELPTGGDAIAANMRPGTGILTVMRPGDETTRIDVPLANTDLKESLTALYERYKEYHRNRVVQQRTRARALKERANGASEDQMKLAGPKPEVRPGGVVPIMLASIEKLKLKELKASAITQWGGVNFEEVDGKIYWTGTVQCTVENALFGPTLTEVMALMKDNEVVKWLYTGSREEVQ
jgi:hypothetical protein